MLTFSCLSAIGKRKPICLGFFQACVVLLGLAIAWVVTAEAQEASAGAEPQLIWSERIEFADMTDISFDGSGEKLLVTGRQSLFFATETGAHASIAGSVVSFSEDGAQTAQLVGNGAWGDEARHRLIVSAPGGSQSSFETADLQLGGFPEVLSSRDGNAHVLVPGSGAIPDNRPVLVTANAPSGQRLELDMSKYPEPVTVTNKGQVIVRTRSGLVLFEPDGPKLKILDYPGDGFLHSSFGAGASLSVDENSFFMLISDPETFEEMLHRIDLSGHGNIAKYQLPDLDQMILSSLAEMDGGMRAAFYSYADKARQSVYVFDLFNDRDPRLVAHLQTEAEFVRPTLDRGGNLLAVASSDNQLSLYSFAASTEPADIDTQLPVPELVVGLGGLNNMIDVVISPDNRFLATADYDGEVWLWDIESERAVRSFGAYPRALLKFSDDGNSLIVSGDGEILQFDIRTRKIQGEYWSSGYPKLSFDVVPGGFLMCHIRGCDFRPDDDAKSPIQLDVPDYLNGAHFCGDQLALYENLDDGTALVFRVKWSGTQNTGNVVPTELTQSKITDITCAPDGPIFVGTDDGKVLSLDANGAVSAQAVFDSQVENLLLLPGEALLVGRKGGSKGQMPASILALKLSTLETIFETTVPLAPDGSGRHLDLLQVSNDLTIAVTVTQNPGSVELANSNRNHVALWDLAAMRNQIAKAAQASVFRPEDFLIAQGIANGGRKPAGIAFSPDGARLAVNYESDTVVWSLQTGQVDVHPRQKLRGGLKMSKAGMFLPEYGKAPLFVGWDRSKVRLPLPPSGSPAHFEWSAGNLIIAANTMTQATADGALVWQGEEPGRMKAHFLNIDGGYSMDWHSLSPSGDKLLVQQNQRLQLYSTSPADKEALWTLTEPQDGSWSFFGLTKPAFSQDGRFIFVIPRAYGSETALLVVDAETGEIVHKEKHSGLLASPELLPVQVVFHGDAPNLLALLYIGADGFAELLRDPDDKEAGRVNLLGLAPSSAATSGDGRFLVVNGTDGRTLFWDRKTGISRFLEASVEYVPGAQQTVAFSPDGAAMAFSETDGTVSIFDTETATRFARLVSFADGGWATVGEDGRYDASDPGNVERLSWVMPDDPLFPMAVEAYIQEYFEPRLVGRLFAGEDLPALPLPLERNRVTPEVEIIDIFEPVPREDGTTTVTISLTVNETMRGGKSSGFGAVKLFRDGHLVAFDNLANQGADSAVHLEFEGIAIPPGEKEITFSAYAFNDDSIKSRTVSKSYTPTVISDTPPHRRAFVIAVGINAYDNPAWDLNYAAADAEATTKVLGEQLRKSGTFDEVIEIALTSHRDNRSDGLAKRAMIEAVLGQLAGTSVSQDPDTANAPVLPKARPQDLVYIALAGHGLAAKNGVFHFFTQEFGSGLSGRRLPEDLASQSLDSTRLGDLLRAIDARDMVLVIDACNSAASVEGSGFKPGPMGSSGLGQLAYDKAMRVLAASQAEALALESEQLRHGALTFALMREGLEAAAADGLPEDGNISMGELLTFGLQRVPDLYESLRMGSFEPLTRGAFNLSVAGAGTQINLQQPSLFDYRTRNRDDLMIGTVN